MHIINVERLLPLPEKALSIYLSLIEQEIDRVRCIAIPPYHYNMERKGDKDTLIAEIRERQQELNKLEKEVNYIFNIYEPDEYDNIVTKWQVSLYSRLYSEKILEGLLGGSDFIIFNDLLLLENIVSFVRREGFGRKINNKVEDIASVFGAKYSITYSYNHDYLPNDENDPLGFIKKLGYEMVVRENTPYEVAQKFNKIAGYSGGIALKNIFGYDKKSIRVLIKKLSEITF